MKIVRIALENYFFKDIPIDETIKNHNNIYDFCLRLRTNKDSTAQYVSIVDERLNTKDLSRTTRYYVSNSGGMLQKKFNDGRINSVNVGYISTIFNNYIEKPMGDYNINYNFYITETRKIIDQIEDRQLLLF